MYIDCLLLSANCVLPFAHPSAGPGGGVVRPNRNWPPPPPTWGRGGSGEGGELGGDTSKNWISPQHIKQSSKISNKASNKLHKSNNF